jgi:hypothetical protein
LLKFCVKIPFCKHYFRKRKQPDPGPCLCLMDPDPDPDLGGPKTYGYCGSGSGSPTLVTTRIWIWIRSKPWLCKLLHRRLTEIGTLLPMCSVLCVLCFLSHNLGPVRLLCPLLRTLLCLAAYLLCSLFPPLLCIIRLVQVLCCALICAYSPLFCTVPLLLDFCQKI